MKKLVIGTIAAAMLATSGMAADFVMKVKSRCKVIVHQKVWLLISLKKELKINWWKN